MKKSFGQAGMTLVEMTVTIALVAVLGGIVYTLVRYADRQTKIQTEDIQNLIMKYGGSKILQTDIARATPSFNFVQIPDKDNKPFFVLALNDYCQHADCQRQIKMEIPVGQIESEPFFLLTIHGVGDEMIRYTIEPSSTFDSGAYQGINPHFNDPDKTIDKTNIEYSPWTKDRLILLSTTNQFLDCNSLTNSLTVGASTCALNCRANNTCNYATTRFMNFLGVVNNISPKDMDPAHVVNRPTLFNNIYRICQPDTDLNCSVPASRAFTMESSQNLFEKMPFLPGSDNLTNLTPVRLIRYHLQRPTPNSPDHKIFLMRSVATIAGTGQLSFGYGHVTMTGIQSIVFTRKNVSNPTIEYKLNKVRNQISIK